MGIAGLFRWLNREEVERTLDDIMSRSEKHRYEDYLTLGEMLWDKRDRVDRLTSYFEMEVSRRVLYDRLTSLYELHEEEPPKLPTRLAQRWARTQQLGAAVPPALLLGAFAATFGWLMTFSAGFAGLALGGVGASVWTKVHYQKRHVRLIRKLSVQEYVGKVSDYEARYDILGSKKVLGPKLDTALRELGIFSYRLKTLVGEEGELCHLLRDEIEGLKSFRGDLGLFLRHTRRMRASPVPFAFNQAMCCYRDALSRRSSERLELDKGQMWELMEEMQARGYEPPDYYRDPPDGWKSARDEGWEGKDGYDGWLA